MREKQLFDGMFTLRIIPKTRKEKDEKYTESL